MAWFAKVELLLDGAIEGPVWLSDERVASQVAEGLHYRHGKVYRLDAFTIMANHVHTVWVRDDVEWQRTLAYVLNNPLKAGYVERWQDWKWSYRRV